MRRVDLITGDIVGPASDPSLDRNPTTRVLARVGRADWARDGDRYSVAITMPASASPRYLRVRGTATDQLEPRPDEPGEDPWDDLWFYSNPIFIEVD